MKIMSYKTAKLKLKIENYLNYRVKWKYCDHGMT